MCVGGCVSGGGGCKGGGGAGETDRQTHTHTEKAGGEEQRRPTFELQIVQHTQYLRVRYFATVSAAFTPY